MKNARKNLVLWKVGWTPCLFFCSTRYVKKLSNDRFFLFKMINFSSKLSFFNSDLCLNRKKCHLMTFYSWLESKRTRAKERKKKEPEIPRLSNLWFKSDNFKNSLTPLCTIPSTELKLVVMMMAVTRWKMNGDVYWIRFCSKFVQNLKTLFFLNWFVLKLRFGTR